MVVVASTFFPTSANSATLIVAYGVHAFSNFDNHTIVLNTSSDGSKVILSNVLCFLLPA
jgi:hypothetical protein